MVNNQVKTLAYPLGLGSSEKDDAGMPAQYTLFRINDTTKSAKLKDDSGYSKVTVSSLARQGTGIEAGAYRGGLDDQLLVQKYGVDAIAANKTLVEQKQMTRVNKVIVLPMADNHTVDTRVNYADTDQTSLTVLGDMWNAGAGAVLSGGISMLKAKIVEKVLNSSDTVNSAAGKITGKQGPLTSMSAQLAASRKIENPKREMLYRDFGRRRFRFTYYLAPKSEQEANAVDDIIETFRYYSLPELDPSLFYYNFPAEFEISFMHDGMENKHIPRIATCALEDVSVNYSPRGDWASFADGSPVVRQMTLSFVELELIDRRRVWTKDNPIISGY